MFAYTQYCKSNMFKFLEPFKIPDDQSANGLILNGIYLPVELLSIILNFIPPKQLLELSLVCKSWCNLIKSENLWIHIYNCRHPNKGKKLPWYVYYCYFTTESFTNLLRNGNGEKRFQHWKIRHQSRQRSTVRFKIENPPCGSDPLPNGVPDFNGNTSCFSTSYEECMKVQIITIGKVPLLQYIIQKFRPHLYVSEWVAGRFDCGCMYRLTVRGYSEEEMLKTGTEIANIAFEASNTFSVKQWEGSKWEKVEILVENYPKDIHTIAFEHAGRDTQYWRGHYGSKMAGGVVKFLIDSIQPEMNNEDLADYSC